jgi:hypothetical protein
MPTKTHKKPEQERVNEKATVFRIWSAEFTLERREIGAKFRGSFEDLIREIIQRQPFCFK